MGRTLVAYFSRAGENFYDGSYRYVLVGNTEIVVNHIKELIDVEYFKIEMKEPYSVNYNTCIEQAKKDQRMHARPEIGEDMLNGVEEYDNIILAYPLYWGTLPMAMFTFLDKYMWTGARILPLCTHEGGGMGRSEQDIRSLCIGARVEKGLAITGSQAEYAKPLVEEWLKENGLL